MRATRSEPTRFDHGDRAAECPKVSGQALRGGGVGLIVDFGANLVLVTGALGWLGRGLVHALVEGLPDVDRLRHPDPDLSLALFLRFFGEA